MSITPGPWTANVFMVTAANGRGVTHTGLLGRQNASVVGQDGSQEDEDNARAISALPDLIEAGKLVMSFHTRQVELTENPDNGDSVLSIMGAKHEAFKKLKAALEKVEPSEPGQHSSLV